MGNCNSLPPYPYRQLQNDQCPQYTQNTQNTSRFFESRYYEQLPEYSPQITHNEDPPSYAETPIDISGYVCDEFGNINCHNCLNCVNCVNCYNCIKCKNCINCKNCKDKQYMLNNVLKITSDFYYRYIINIWRKKLLFTNSRIHNMGR